jgi:hypothetical protein
MSSRTRLFVIALCALLLWSSGATVANTNTQFRLAIRGAALMQTEGTSNGVSTGFARIQLDSGSAYPSGVAIFAYRKDNVLISEAAVPAAIPSTSARIYAEIGGGVDTGLAIANPNPQAANITFYFTDETGARVGASGDLTIVPNGKTSQFLTEPPFNGVAPFRGTFTLTSNVPVVLTALRGLTNSRNEFLITTLPVAPTSGTQTGTLYIPHFADGGGWRTQVILVNPSDTSCSGVIRFFDKGSESAAAPMLSETAYTIAPSSSFRLITDGTPVETKSGSVRVFPGTGQTSPTTLALFSFTRNGIIVAEAGISGTSPAATFRIYAEGGGNFAAGEAGSSQTGFAITNGNTTTNAAVTLELMNLSGSVLQTSTVTVPARGQLSKFLNEIPEFKNVSLPFYGVLRVRSTVSGGIAVTGLRGRYNERTDFLFASTPPVIEGTASNTEVMFSYFADGGGYTTQFILLSNVNSQASAGSMSLYDPTGSPAALALRSVVAPKPLVNILSAGNLISTPASLFDLEARTLRLTPSGSTYSIQSLPLAFDETSGAVLSNSQGTLGGQDPFVRSWSVPLSFSFPFGGQNYNAVYVNSFGSLTFGSGESTTTIANRDPWPNATMISNAAAIDSLAAVGIEKMIAVFWGPFDAAQSTIRVASNADEVTVTWQAARNNRFVSSLGMNTFQAKLRRTGAIDLSYKQIAELDGITGVFTGQLTTATTLDHIDRNSTADPLVRVNSVDVADVGNTIRFSLVIGSDIVSSVATGSMNYRISLRIAGRDCTYEVIVTSSGRRPRANCHGAQPEEFGYTVAGTKLDIFASKLVIDPNKTFSWAFDVVYFGPTTIFENSLGSYRSISLNGPTGLDLSAANGVLTVATKEVFHYPVFSRNPAESLSWIYQSSPPVDDLALVFTDFRYDEIFGGEGPSYSPPGNDSIQGINTSFGSASSAITFGSRQLLVSPSPAYIGHPPFDERVTYQGRQFTNYGFGVVWAAHEMTHHWVTRLRFKNPQTGQVEALGDSGDHWLHGLQAPSYKDVSSEYSTAAFAQSSPMGQSSLWVDNFDGTFTETGNYFRNIGGWSALDLYCMGVLAPEEVPDVFLLKDLVSIGGNRYRATKVPVRIQDVIAAEGPRVPAAANSQKVFRLGVYLLYDPSKTPNAIMKSRAEEYARALMHYFDFASGGRIKLVL